MCYDDDNNNMIQTINKYFQQSAGSTKYEEQQSKTVGKDPIIKSLSTVYLIQSELNYLYNGQCCTNY